MDHKIVNFVKNVYPTKIGINRTPISKHPGGPERRLSRSRQG